MDPTGPRGRVGTAPQRTQAEPPREAARHTTPSTGPARDPGFGRDAHQEHLIEEELPRDTRVYLLTPVEDPMPGETLD